MENKTSNNTAETNEKKFFSIKPDTGIIHGDYLLMESCIFLLGEDIIPSQVKQIEEAKRALNIQNNYVLTLLFNQSKPKEV